MNITREWWNKILIITLLVVLVSGTIYFFPHDRKTFTYEYEVGTPWVYNSMVAQEAFLIHKTDEQMALEKEELLRTYTPYYQFAEGTTNKPVLVMDAQEKENWFHQNVTKIALTSNKKVTTYLLDSICTPKTAYQRFGRECEINIFYDTATSTKVLSALMARITPTQGLVQKGEKIIDKGEIVTPETARILDTLRANSKEKTISYQQRIWANVALSILITLLFGCFILYVFVFRHEYLNQLNTMGFFYLLSAIVLWGMLWIIKYTQWNVYFVPILWIPIMARVFYDSRTALFLYITNILILSLAVPRPFEFLIIQLATGLIVLTNIKIMTQRSQLARTSAYAIIGYSALYTTLVIATTGDWHNIVPMQYLAFTVNGVALLGAYGLIFVFEKLFGLTSSITLIELSNINSDLMLKFAQQCPGSFQHSLQVSTLATEAARCTNANMLLVRTGALYHDIGKLAHPNNFTENQANGYNPLLDMTSLDAAQVVIAHVEDGVKIAQKNNIPEVIINFIRTHHGDSLVRFFYNNYVNEHPDEQVDESLFRYTGPRPNDKECAIVMMADAIEARSRSLTKYTEKTINDMVDQMVDVQMQDNQFSETPLSFKDISVIKDIFKEKLIAMYHHRIVYPTLNKS